MRRRTLKRASTYLLASVVLSAVLAAGRGGGDSSSSVAATNEHANVKTTKEGFGTGTVEATLQPVGDNPDASGHFQYTVEPDESRLIKLQAKGLAPASGARQYAVWQKDSRHDMVLLATWHVGKNRLLTASWEPNSATQRFLEDGSRTKVLITRVGDNERLSEARNSYDHIYIGIPVLEGDITGPLVGLKEGG